MAVINTIQYFAFSKVMITMKAAVIHRPGSPEELTLEERPVPIPGNGQVLVKVKAFGLNRSELMTRKGLSPGVQFPRVLGIECVGEAQNDPSGTYMNGQPVMALMGGMGRDFDGSYAEYSVLQRPCYILFRVSYPGKCWVLYRKCFKRHTALCTRPSIFSQVKLC